MKNKLLRNTRALGLAGLLIFVCPGCSKQQALQEHRGDKNHALLLRGKDDQNLKDKWRQILTDVLNKPTDTAGADDRKTLFRVRKYTSDPDQPWADYGTLDEAFIMEDINTINQEAAQNHFTGYAIQIGLGAVDDYRSIPQSTPAMPQAHYRQNIIESQKMVDKVNEILGYPSPSPSPSP
jgi:hypothetical protein